MDDPFVTPLGAMSIVEMLLFYEGPKLFTCRDVVGTLYMAHYVEEDNDAERWFLVPMSAGRVEEVRTGALSLRQSILLSETGALFDLYSKFDHPGEGTVLSRSVQSLTEDELPGEAARLKRPADRLPQIQEDTGTEASQAMRDVLRIALDNGRHDQVIQAEHLGAVLLRTQNLVRYLGDRRIASRGPLPKETAERNTLMFTGTYAASVGIRLQSKCPTDLLDTPSREALELFLSLLEAGDQREKLNPILHDVPKRVVSRYRFLLSILDIAELNYRVEWGSPGRIGRSATLTRTQARSILDLLDEEGDDLTEFITVSGDLTGVVKSKGGRRARFEFVARDGTQYRGTIAPELINHDFQVTTYGASITLEATTEINQATGEEHVSYVLVGIDGVGRVDEVSTQSGAG